MNVFQDEPYHRTGFTLVSGQPDRVRVILAQLAALRTHPQALHARAPGQNHSRRMATRGIQIRLWQFRSRQSTISDIPAVGIRAVDNVLASPCRAVSVCWDARPVKPGGPRPALPLFRFLTPPS